MSISNINNKRNCSQIFRCRLLFIYSHESPPYKLLSHLNAGITWGGDGAISLWFMVVWNIRKRQPVHHADVVQDEGTGDDFTPLFRGVLEHSTRAVNASKSGFDNPNAPLHNTSGFALRTAVALFRLCCWVEDWSHQPWSQSVATITFYWLGKQLGQLLKYYTVNDFVQSKLKFITSYSPNNHPSGISPSLNFMPVPEFINMKESWVLPGHLATRSVTLSVASQIT